MNGSPFPCQPSILVAQLLQRERRVLLFGPTGIGKTTLAGALAAELAAQGRPVWGLGADPGAPTFAVPGSVCLGTWREGTWSPVMIEALCTLDAGRFRLPLAAAAGRLAGQLGAGTLLVDAPGVVRGVAGAELLESLVQTIAVDLVLVLYHEGQPLSLAQELDSLDVEVASVRASEQARRPGKIGRARRRTRLWDLHLSGADEHAVALAGLHLVGTPPRNAAEAWQGKQVAFLERGRTCAMGEVVGADGTRLRVRLPSGQLPTSTLLVRDACRGSDGLLTTGKPFAAELVRYIPPPDVLPDASVEAPIGPRPIVQVGAAIASLVNGVFGDPLVHLRLRQQRRSLLFDLGDGSRLPARIAHQVTDVFISHAHADHIGGFLWLLRSRIGERGVCRLYGPPGLARQVEGFVAGILWDRIGDRGPVFEVAELHGECLRRFRVQAGEEGSTWLGECAVGASVLLQEEGLRVRYAVLDHGTPVLAFAYDPGMQIKVRKERLSERRLRPGPWLTSLKQRMAKGEYDAELDLPDGSRQAVAELAVDLTLASPGDKLVYATDFADTPQNRRRLIELAAGAHTLFCEASFLEQAREQAQRTGHLTARACGEIASAAGVRYLIPFHFSRRYEDAPWRLYDEIAAACPQTVVPKQPIWEGP